MEPLRIITQDWKIVNYEDYLFIKAIRYEYSEDGQDDYSIIGIIDDELNYIVLYSSNDTKKIAYVFNSIAHAIEARRPIIDLREEERSSDSITLLENSYGKPGSDLN